MAETLFTFRVILNRKQEGTDMYEQHEVSDCTVDKLKTLRETVWTQGFKIQVQDHCWEIVSPFHIRSVFFFIQKPDK